MMRILIDSDAIGTRRRRSRFRTSMLVLALMYTILELSLISHKCGLEVDCYPTSDDLDGSNIDEFPGEVNPILRQVVQLPQQVVSLDDDADNEISRASLLASLDSSQSSDQRGSEGRVEDFGELALARLLSSSAQPQQRRTNYGEVYLLEDKDYPKSLFEDYARERVGQVSGIASMPALRGEGESVAIFHRATRHWDEHTFNETSKQVAREKQDDLIKENTLMIIDRDGRALKSFGSQLFYMPHSVASDHLGNLWVSDVARHQVMRLPAMRIASMNKSTTSGGDGGDDMQIWPDIILGEAFVGGTDASHFCQPSEIAVSSNGQLVYVADGYCNQRVMVFSGSSGKLVGSFGQQENMQVVHSLTLIEEKNLLCVADRENHRILCYNAGLQGNPARMGELIDQIEYPIGRVFAIASVSPDHLLVSSKQAGTNRYDLAILNPFTHELKLVWTSSDLLEPHSLTTTVDRQYAYAADLSKDAYKKVFKFHVIQRKN